VRELEARGARDRVVVLWAKSDASLIDTFALPLKAVTIAEAYR
jgi:F0F1-type ATP synthase alpha subunit